MAAGNCLGSEVNCLPRKENSFKQKSFSTRDENNPCEAKKTQLEKRKSKQG
jgi:hypothetical protein